MKKFLVLYMANAAEFEKMMQELDSGAETEGDGRLDEMDGRQQGVARRWRSAFGQDEAGRLKGASDTKNDIGGYSIVQADSADAATRIFGKDHPHLQMPGAWIEVIEVMQIPGM